jgi:hypothetical protein
MTALLITRCGCVSIQEVDRASRQHSIELPLRQEVRPFSSNPVDFPSIEEMLVQTRVFKYVHDLVRIPVLGEVALYVEEEQK